MRVPVVTCSGRELITLAAEPSWRLREVLAAALEESGALDCRARAFFGSAELCGDTTLADLGVERQPLDSRADPDPARGVWRPQWAGEHLRHVRGVPPHAGRPQRARPVRGVLARRAGGADGLLRPHRESVVRCLRRVPLHARGPRQPRLVGTLLAGRAGGPDRLGRSHGQGLVCLLGGVPARAGGPPGQRARRRVLAPRAGRADQLERRDGQDLERGLRGVPAHAGGAGPRGPTGRRAVRPVLGRRPEGAHGLERSDSEDLVHGLRGVPASAAGPPRTCAVGGLLARRAGGADRFGGSHGEDLVCCIWGLPADIGYWKATRASFGGGPGGQHQHTFGGPRRLCGRLRAGRGFLCRRAGGAHGLERPHSEGLVRGGGVHVHARRLRRELCPRAPSL
ncbi:unnamed protein product [Prorocentrum cordatum]|uniref:Ubiquitin-like domain-containing protein n=1 Tax=Prorocentrum cordatum TaxID=2364126 RepID=A0ABN9VBN9_9DINO|nr:unnamed protein product [Polarella glacialis]